MVVTFREVLHPRDRRGRFRKKRNIVTPPGTVFQSITSNDAAQWDRPDLTDDEEQALTQYHQGDFEPVNAYLRGQERGASTRLKGITGNVESGTEKGVVPENVMAYRVMNDPEVAALFQRGDLVGAKITDDGAMSTTLNADDVDKIRNTMFDPAFAPEGSTPIVMSLAVPKGTHGLFEGGDRAGTDLDEGELLLRPGTTAHIDAAYMDDTTEPPTLRIAGTVTQQYADNPDQQGAQAAPAVSVTPTETNPPTPLERLRGIFRLASGKSKDDMLAESDRLLNDRKNEEALAALSDTGALPENEKDRAALAKTLTELRDAAPYTLDTEKAYTDENGAYTPERKALHDQIVAKYLDDHQPHDDPPKITFTAGGPASGKSTGLAAVGGLEPEDAVPVNPDLIKDDLPEFAALAKLGDEWSPTKVHEESSAIAKRIQREAADRGLNMAMDSSGDGKPGHFVGKLKQMQDKGYDVSVAYFNIPTETALTRGHERARLQAERGETPRELPEGYTRETHRGVSRNWPDVIKDDSLEDVKLYDNSQPFGQPPTLVAEKRRGNDLEVREPGMYQTFLDKAKEPDWKPETELAQTRFPSRSGGSPQTTTGLTSQSQPTREMATLEGALDQIGDLEQANKPEALRYGGYEDLVRDKGTRYDKMGDASEMPRGEPKQCYKNASDLADSDPGLTYVEGYGISDKLPIPIAHAWVVNGDGEVIDNTWPDAAGEKRAYIGIPYSNDERRRLQLKAGVYDLHNHDNAEELLGGGPDALQSEGLDRRIKGKVIPAPEADQERHTVDEIADLIGIGNVPDGASDEPADGELNRYIAVRDPGDGTRTDIYWPFDGPPQSRIRGYMEDSGAFSPDAEYYEGAVNLSDGYDAFYNIDPGEATGTNMDTNLGSVPVEVAEKIRAAIPDPRKRRRQARRAEAAAASQLEAESARPASRTQIMAARRNAPGPVSGDAKDRVNPLMVADIESGPRAGNAVKALDLIGKTVDQGKTDTPPVFESHLSDLGGADAQYRPPQRNDDGLPHIASGVPSTVTTPITTMTHEYGHYLDHYEFGDPQREGNGPLGLSIGTHGEGPNSDLVKPVMDAITNSDKHKELLQARNDDPLAQFFGGGQSWYEYASRPEEEFARAFAQYVHEENPDDEEMNREWDEWEQGNPGDFHYSRWDKSDFAPIRAAMKEAFQKRAERGNPPPLVRPRRGGYDLTPELRDQIQQGTSGTYWEDGDAFKTGDVLIDGTSPWLVVSRDPPSELSLGDEKQITLGLLDATGNRRTMKLNSKKPSNPDDLPEFKKFRRRSGPSLDPAVQAEVNAIVKAESDRKEPDGPNALSRLTFTPGPNADPLLQARISREDAINKTTSLGDPIDVVEEDFGDEPWDDMPVALRERAVHLADVAESLEGDYLQRSGGGAKRWNGRIVLEEGADKGRTGAMEWDGTMRLDRQLLPHEEEMVMAHEMAHAYSPVDEQDFTEAPGWEEGLAELTMGDVMRNRMLNGKTKGADYAAAIDQVNDGAYADYVKNMKALRDQSVPADQLPLSQEQELAWDFDMLNRGIASRRDKAHNDTDARMMEAFNAGDDDKGNAIGMTWNRADDALTGGRFTGAFGERRGQ